MRTWWFVRHKAFNLASSIWRWLVPYSVTSTKKT
jgi:hypothetical protein